MTNVIRGPWAGRPGEPVTLVGLEDGRVLELGEPTCRGSVLIDDEVRGGPVKTRPTGRDE